MGGLYHLALRLRAAGGGLLSRSRALSDRQVRARPHRPGRGGRRVRQPGAGLAVLRGAVPFAARPARGGAGARGLRLSGRPHLCLHPCVQRARRLYPDRCADRHHHGGERLHHRHPEPEEDRGRAAGRQGAGPALGRRGQAAFGAQQLSHAAGRLPDDLQPLSADVRDALQLADRRHRARGRPGHPSFLQFPARGQGQPMVDLGRGGRRHDRRGVAVGRRTRGRPRRARRNSTSRPPRIRC